MWGSLARGITETVKETATFAADSVAPHAGDVLRRVGEVVAPADGSSYDDDDDDGEWEEEDEESYYDDDDDDDELGVDFEAENSGDEEVEAGGDSPDLDRYRKNKGGPLFAAVDSPVTKSNNASVALATSASANSLVNGDPQIFSEDKKDVAAVRPNVDEGEQTSKQDAVEAMTVTAAAAPSTVEEEAQKLEADIAAAERAERDRSERDAIEGQKKIEDEARRAEAERLEEERLAAEEAKERSAALEAAAAKEAERRRIRAERETQRRLDAEAAAAKRANEERLEKERTEARRMEKERMDRQKMLEEDRRKKEEAEARHQAAQEKKRQEEEKVAAAEAAEKRRLAEEEAASLAAQANAENERLKHEQLTAAKEKAARQQEGLYKIEKEKREEQIQIEAANVEAERPKLRVEKELEELYAEVAAKRAMEERLQKERFDHYTMEDMAVLANGERMEKERLDAEEAAAKMDIKILEREKIEQEIRSEEQRHKGEAARQRAREREEATATEAQTRAESTRADSERLECTERERINEEEARATSACEATLREETQNQKMQLRESADRIAQLLQERNQLQSSNEQLQTMHNELQTDLHRAAETISTLRGTAADQEEKERLRWEQEARRVEDEESSLLAASKLDLENKMSHLRESLEGQIRILECELAEERKLSVNQQHELQQRLEEATARLSTTEKETSALWSKKEAKAAKQIQASEKAAAKAVALLDQKEEETQQLQQVIADMRETMKKNKLEEEEAEDEMDELHNENEELHQQLEKLQKENAEMKSKLTSMSDDSEKLGGLKMELQMLEEERKREKSALESAQSKTSEGYAVVISERDAAKAQTQNLEQLLTAARADLELAQTDHSRAMTANENLQRALEDFQGERDAEITLLTEQRVADEEAIAAAHTASLEATREAAAAEMRDVQYAADKSVQNALAQMDKMEVTIQECRRDNLNLRRALDEAIARLQTNQEDVIDRSLIKNVILDWHSKKGKGKRDVMVLLGSILHFTEDEKDKAFIGEGPGTLDKVYGAVAAPLPPAKLHVDKIEGDTVREKWVNFLMAETGEDEGDN